jgi:threonine/homoserine efflux transporter RhtA
MFLTTLPWELSVLSLRPLLNNICVCARVCVRDIIAAIAELCVLGPALSLQPWLSLCLFVLCVFGCMHVAVSRSIIVAIAEFMFVCVVCL